MQTLFTALQWPFLFLISTASSPQTSQIDWTSEQTKDKDEGFQMYQKLPVPQFVAS